MVARRGAAGERTQPAAYPNGRALTNDVFSARMAFLTNGKPAPTASDRTTTSWASLRSPARRTPNPKQAAWDA